MEDAAKKAYIEKMEAKLTRLKADLQQVQAEFKARKAEAEPGLQEKLESMREASEKLDTRLCRLKTASGAAWDEAREGCSRAWFDLQSAFSRAKNRFQRGE